MDFIELEKMLRQTVSSGILFVVLGNILVRYVNLPFWVHVCIFALSIIFLIYIIYMLAGVQKKYACEENTEEVLAFRQSVKRKTSLTVVILLVEVITFLFPFILKQL